MPFIRNRNTGVRTEVSNAMIVAQQLGNNVVDPNNPNSTFSSDAIAQSVSKIYPSLLRPIRFLTLGQIGTSLVNEYNPFEDTDLLNISNHEHDHIFTLEAGDHVYKNDRFGGTVQSVISPPVEGNFEVVHGHVGGYGAAYWDTKHLDTPARSSKALISVPLKDLYPTYWEMRIDKMPTSCDETGGNEIDWSLDSAPIINSSGSRTLYNGADIMIMVAKKDYDHQWTFFPAGEGRNFSLWLRPFKLMSEIIQRHLRNIEGDIDDENEVNHTQAGDIIQFAYDPRPRDGQRRLFIGRNGKWMKPALGDSADFARPNGLFGSYDPNDDSAGWKSGFIRPGVPLDDVTQHMYLSPIWGREAMDSDGTPQTNNSINFGFTMLHGDNTVYDAPTGFIKH